MLNKMDGKLFFCLFLSHAIGLASFAGALKPFNLPCWYDGCAHASMSLSSIVVKTYYCFYYFNFSVLDVNWLFVLFLCVVFSLSLLSSLHRNRRSCYCSVHTECLLFVVIFFSLSQVFFFTTTHRYIKPNRAWNSASVNPYHCFMPNVDI